MKAPLKFDNFVRGGTLHTGNKNGQVQSQSSMQVVHGTCDLSCHICVKGFMYFGCSFSTSVPHATCRFGVQAALRIWHQAFKIYYEFGFLYFLHVNVFYACYHDYDIDLINFNKCRMPYYLLLRKAFLHENIWMISTCNYREILQYFPNVAWCHVIMMSLKGALLHLFFLFTHVLFIILKIWSVNVLSISINNKPT